MLSVEEGEGGGGGRVVEECFKKFINISPVCVCGGDGGRTQLESARTSGANAPKARENRRAHRTTESRKKSSKNVSSRSLFIYNC